jgi:hypothetical protein
MELKSTCELMNLVGNQKNCAYTSIWNIPGVEYLCYGVKQLVIWTLKGLNIQYVKNYI